MAYSHLDQFASNNYIAQLKCRVQTAKCTEYKSHP